MILESPQRKPTPTQHRRFATSGLFRLRKFSSGAYAEMTRAPGWPWKASCEPGNSTCASSTTVQSCTSCSTGRRSLTGTRRHLLLEPRALSSHQLAWTKRFLCRQLYKCSNTPTRSPRATSWRTRTPLGHEIVARVQIVYAEVGVPRRHLSDSDYHGSSRRPRTLLYPKNVSAARYRLSGTVFVSPVASASDTVTISSPRSATIWPHSPFLTASAALRP